jgi:ABC-type multidrug transport system ATPase subunit
VNGAGKSTTFRLITGEIEADRGEILIKGCNIKTNRNKARQNIGYCSQLDCLPESLNVEETLNLFAQLRGIKPHRKAIEDMIGIFYLDEFRKTLVQNLR